MATCYSVKHSFAHDGVFFSPGDAHKIPALIPPEKIAELEKLGLIEQYDDTFGHPALAADAPVNVKAAHTATLDQFLSAAPHQEG